MQDPRASLRRQARAAQDALPAGFTIVAWYWDIESGAMDLQDRGQGHAWEQFTDIGIPRDGGVAELMARACGPAPEFAVVVCEDIERAARDTLASLTLEKELSRHGIPIFATDEPASLEGANPTTILVRRVRQGVAEFFRLQLLQKTWKGLTEHAIDGWNIGPTPYGYLPDRVPHPAPAKAAQGRTKTRLVPDPQRGPVVTQIFTWRVDKKLAVSTIAARLNADPGLYPPPGQAPGWAETTVTAILRNPKYTGHMVYGRTRKTPGSKKPRPVPPDQWIWSPEPKHTPLTDRDTWQAAQTMGAERGNFRDPEMPPAHPGRHYSLRSRIRHAACQRRMCGIRRPSGNGTSEYVYYTCPYKASNPRHAAACPGHPVTSVSVREDTVVAAITAFLDQYVFGYDRAAMLKDRIPVTTAEHAAARAREHARLSADIARIDTAQAGLLTELEQLGADKSPATQAYRTRIRARNSEYHDQRTATQTQLDTLNAAATPRDDPALLDELPHLTTTLAGAPAPLIEDLLTALDLQVLYRPEQDQATIWATLTDTTPQTINALLNDPRTSTTLPGLHPAGPFADLPQDPPVHRIHRQARIHHADPGHGAGTRPAVRQPGRTRPAATPGSATRRINTGAITSAATTTARRPPPDTRLPPQEPHPWNIGPVTTGPMFHRASEPGFSRDSADAADTGDAR
jgi:site-specific DNA recombinase